MPLAGSPCLYTGASCRRCFPESRSCRWPDDKAPDDPASHCCDSRMRTRGQLAISSRIGRFHVPDRLARTQGAQTYLMASPATRLGDFLALRLALCSHILVPNENGLVGPLLSRVRSLPMFGQLNVLQTIRD